MPSIFDSVYRLLQTLPEQNDNENAYFGTSNGRYDDADVAIQNSLFSTLILVQVVTEKCHRHDAMGSHVHSAC